MREARPGADWNEPKSTIDPRRRTNKQRVQLVAVAAITFAVGFAAFEIVEGTPQSAQPLSFHLDEQAGISFAHTKGWFDPFFTNVLPFMQAVSAAGCVGDVDQDGLLDVYLVSSGQDTKNRLFKNLGAFKFQPIEQPAIEDLNHDGFSSDCTFADIDNDGWVDLFVGATAQQPRLFKNDHGTFVDVTATAGGPAYMNGFADAFFDADNDGDLDLIMSSYFGEVYPADEIASQPRIHTKQIPNDPHAGRMLPNNWGDATNGGQKHLFLNDGTGRFVEADAASWGIGETRFTFDVGTGDINQDGWTDVYFANDFGPDQLLLNQGGKKFVQIQGTFPTDVGRDSFKGMNADLADIDHDGYPEIYVTNVFHPVLPEGNILWHNRPHPSGDPFLRDFQNVAADVGVKDGGWGWGAKFVDIDLDGDTDIVATNGYITGEKTSEYWYRLSRLVAGDRRLIVDTRKWPPFEGRSMSGHQVSHVFVREGARFYNRAADAGVMREFDGRGVVIADFDVDGRPDVLFVPQGAPIQLLRNAFVATAATPTAPHWIGVRVQGDGARVAKSCVGCRVKVTSQGVPTYREVSAGNGMTGQSMPWVLVGLGASAAPVDVEVRFTDGTTQTLKGAAPDRYYDVVKTVQTAALEVK